MFIELNKQEHTMTKLYIGLDVHKASISFGIAQPGNEPPEYYGKCASSIDTFERTLRRVFKKYDVTREHVKICYEAGPTGFVLARRLIKNGFDLIVVPPSHIPSKPGDKIKTDRRDALKLARLLRAGELPSVNIPDAADEAVRDVSRARTDAVDDLRRNRFRLGSFLLRNGHSWQGRTRWGAQHMRYLRELCLSDPAQRMALEEYLQAIDEGEARVKRLEVHLERLLDTWERANWVAAIQGFRGFQLVGSMIIASELGDITRFDHPRQLMAYLGLVPGEHSSGERRQQGGITKCGNSHARWILIESATHYRLPPRISKELSVRQEGLSRDIKGVSWRAQNRLSKRYHRLKMKGLHENKVKVAVARELVAFLWEAAHILNQQHEQAA
jgi:transposase